MQTNTNISSSIEKIFFILKKLCLSDVARKAISMDFSADTLNIYLSTLKKLNIEITSPIKSYPFYSIKSNMNFPNLNMEDIKLLSAIKTILGSECSYKEIINYNIFLENLLKYTNSFYAEQIAAIVLQPPFDSNAHKIIYLLEEHIKNKNNLLLTYYSPISKINYFEICPLDIKLENFKIYLTCFDNNSLGIKYLRIDRIREIKVIKQQKIQKRYKQIALCHFKNISGLQITNSFQCNSIKENQNGTLAQIYYDNEFDFIQKILSFGVDVKILQPKLLQNKIKKILTAIRSNYNEEIQ